MDDQERKQLSGNEKDYVHGRDCFFSEATFLRVMGPGPSLEERLHSLATRPKTQEMKKKMKIQLDRSILKSAPKVGEGSRKTILQRSNVGNNNESPLGKAPTSHTKVQKTDLNSKFCMDSLSGEEMANKDVNIVNNSTKQDNVSESDVIHTEDTVNGHASPSSEGDKLSPCKPSFPALSLADQSILKEESSEVTLPEAGNIINGTEVVPDPPPDEMQSPDEDGEELCCLVMPNSSEDEDSDNEDFTQFNGMDNSMLMNSSIQKTSDAKGKPVADNKQETEENFSLVMRSVSSDEESRRGSKPTSYQLHTLNSPQEKRYSVQVSSTNQASGHIENIPIKSELHTSPQGLVKIEPESKTTESEGAVQTEENRSMGGNIIFCGATAQDQTMISGLSNVTAVAGALNINKVPEKKIFQNCRSKLSIKQHKRYVQLYKRYVLPMMKGNQKEKYTEPEMRDLVELEELQQQVSHEQVEYQEYLKQKAQKSPNAYNYLTNVSRIYSHTRYNSYHKPRQYARNFEYDGLFTIPLILEDKDASAMMNFKKTVLKVGHPAKVTLPNVKDGANPVPINVEAKAINAWFPSSNRDLKNNECVDHKMISADSNAMKLSEQEGIDVVMSSSSMKCLMDNHASDIMRAWDIPVTVKSNLSAKQGGKTVYLDKPLYKDDFLLREYNALYHKYALRTLVSQPRGPKVKTCHRNKASQEEEAYTKTVPLRRESLLDSVNLDMFSTESIGNIETFGSSFGVASCSDNNTNRGAHTSKTRSARRESLFDASDLDMFLTGAGATCDIETFGTLSNKRLRSSSMNSSDAPLANETGQRNDVEQVRVTESTGRLTRSKKLSEDVTIMNNEPQPMTESPLSPPTSVHSPMSSNKPSEIPVIESLSPGLKNSDAQKNGDAQSTRRRTRSSSVNNSLQSKLKSNASLHLESENSIEGPPAKVVKTDRDGVTTTTPASDSVTPDSPKRKRRRSRKDHSLTESHDVTTKTDSSLQKQAVLCVRKTLESPASPTKELESPASPTKELESPASPTKELESPASPTKELESPASPTKELESPASPTKELESPLSPIKELKSPASPKATLIEREKVLEVPLSPVKRDFDRPPISVLDSIFGPTDSEACERLKRKRELIEFQGEGWEDMLPVEEKCSCIVYSVWELGSMKLLLRCNRHGTLKDKKKARYVYLSPKMEYQPDCGMEQVTLSEMTRAWTSCFIRPGTNLVRARINAYNSEILMFEELSVERILNPSLPFKPVHNFEVVRRLLKQLTSLPEGHYLLSHFKGMKFCKLRKFHGKGGLMPAPKKKRSGRAREGHVPWIPIDPTILTPSHIFNGRIPATFMPSDWKKKEDRPGGGDWKKKKFQDGAPWRNQNDYNQQPQQQHHHGHPQQRQHQQQGHSLGQQQQQHGQPQQQQQGFPQGQQQQQQRTGWKGRQGWKRGRWNQHKGN